MRLRHIAFMIPGIAIIAPSVTSACSNQAQSTEAVENATAEAAEAARATGTPIGGIVVKGGQNPGPKGRTEAEASTQGGGTRTLYRRSSYRRADYACRQEHQHEGRYERQPPAQGRTIARMSAKKGAHRCPVRPLSTLRSESGLRRPA